MAPCHLRVERFDAGRRLVPASARHPVHPDRLVRRRVIRTPLSCNLRLTPATMRFRSATVRVSEFSKASLTIRMMWCQRSSVMRRASLCPSFCHWTLDPNASEAQRHGCYDPVLGIAGHGPAERVAFVAQLDCDPVLPAKEYREDHLPGAINLPLRQLETEARS